MNAKANKPAASPVLLGNAFPLSLIRRRVVIEPADLKELRLALKMRGVASFWGHENTLEAAGALLAADVRPTSPRPSLCLTGDGLPQFGGRVFDECWVVSPDYPPNWRPSIGEEVGTGKIGGWQVLRIVWRNSQAMKGAAV